MHVWPLNSDTVWVTYIASGLVNMDILTPRWAKENLVFSVPEPGIGAFAGVALLALEMRKAQERHRT